MVVINIVFNLFSIGLIIVDNKSIYKVGLLKIDMTVVYNSCLSICIVTVVNTIIFFAYITIK